ncbi:phosphoenolpyruvate--protein phosphotransferase [Murdochiella vaginalis]|uniref:phosphoenolpyruvate--protein phosphotransferase n=1 Tax=Murdochiella vaginalis TaxID=1852373 RepID=UPI0008FE06D5|nr:phosphoenolpyruvate--protein phosphotransferase [Murdochiella vaginalis]
MTKRIPGIIASYGMAIGVAKRWIPEEIPIRTDWISEDEVDEEFQAVKNAFSAYRIKLKQEDAPSPLLSSLREAHIALLDDPYLLETVQQCILQKHMPADRALASTIRMMAAQLEALEDPYLRERGSDYRDMGRGLLYQLKGLPIPRLDQLSEPCILITEELAPSDALHLDKKNVLGFTSDRGGATSHTSMIAQTMGIPALVGLPAFSSMVEDGDLLILDAENGEVILDPDEETLALVQAKMDAGKRRNLQWATSPQEQALTEDGHRVEVLVNIGGLEDLSVGLFAGAEGVGLFRTELLYMEQDHFPTEEEQLRVYQRAATLLGDRELMIRTLDIGGDKRLPYYAFPREANPFLGWRALRFCFDREDIFRAQLRAILRASAYGNVKIMLPMVISPSEVLHVKKLLEEEKESLSEKHLSFDPHLPIGITVETPAAILLAEDLASCCDFFSIGTNDLTQYLLATDRGNNHVAKLHSPFHPSVVRSIQRAVQAAHAHGIPCGLCGSFAGNLRATPLLLGLGVDALSAPASILPQLKERVRGITLKEAQQLAHAVCGMHSTEEIFRAVCAFSPKKTEGGRE